MSIASNFPDSRPTLNLDFANSRVVDPRITFTRASTATYTNKLGVLSSATSNTPRIDFDPITMACKGLLIEEQRTNLLTYSEQFDNAAWTKAGASISPNSTTAPDNTLTADSLIEDTSTGTHNTRKTTAGTANASPLTFTVYIKSFGRTKAMLALQEATTFTRQTNVIFDLSAGTAAAPANIGGAGDASASVTSVGNGWYRCTLTTTLGGTDNNVYSWIYTVATTFSYTGDGTSGLYIWGAQLEAGAFPTSYIPTTTATATRSADAATMTGTNFSSWYNASEGTLLADTTVFAKYSGVNAFPNAASLDDGSPANQIKFSWGVLSPYTDFRPAIRIAGTGVETFGAINNVNAPSGKFVIAYKTSDNAVTYNAVTPVTGTSAIPSGIIKLGIGQDSAGGNRMNGHIRRITYYQTRLSNAELQGITT